MTHTDLPKSENIKTLPRWAMVAFAARCARRVQPLFRASWPTAPDKRVIALDKAVMLSERSAAYADADEGAFAYAAVAGADVAFAGVVKAKVKVNAKAAAKAAAYAAYTAAKAAAYTADKAADKAADITDITAAAAAKAAACAACATNATNATILRDFQLLKVAAQKENWDDDTPVSPAFFGPMWPNGIPAGWPVDETKKDAEARELVIELDVPDGVTDEDLYKMAVEMADDADSLHRAYGGRGIRLRSIEVEEEAPVREGVST